MLNNFINESVSIFNRYKIYHVLFWLVYIGFWSIILSSGNSWQRDYFNASLFIFFHLVVSYFNNYYLIEWLLFRKRYLTYLVALSLSINLAIFPLSVATYKFIPTLEENANAIWSINFFVYNFIFILFTVLLTTSIKLFRNWFLKEQANKELEKLNIENELKFLKSQINPHFLFNNLNNLYALTIKQSEMAPEVVLKLSNILRFGLYDSQKNKVTIDEDIQFIKDYIELEKLRLGSRTDIQFDVIGDTFNKSIEPFLFINFIENAFKHGANPTLAHIQINILYEITDNNEINFKISNNKPNSTNNLSKSKIGGIGLKNIQARLKILYPNRHTLNIVDENNTYTVTLNLKLT